MLVFLFSATSAGPTVFPLIQCGAEDAEMITLGCLATGFTPSSLTFSWTKNNAALTNFIQYPPVQKNNLYSEVSQIQVRRQDWNQSETVKCMVTHAAGNAQAHIGMPSKPHLISVLKGFTPQSCSHALKSHKLQDFFLQNGIFKCVLCFSYWPNHTSHLVSVTLRCSLHRFTSVFWYFLRPGCYSMLPLAAGPDHSALSCSASVQQTFKPHLHLTAALQHKQIDNSPVWEGEVGNSQVRLICTLSDFFPDKVSVEWQRDSQRINITPVSKKLQSVEAGEKTYTLTSEIEPNTKEWEKGSSFTCKSTHKEQEFSKTFSICQSKYDWRLCSGTNTTAASKQGTGDCYLSPGRLSS
uniref:Ig-like domain-containing protein n=1 Tax=Amphiprion percula TaxID=161767 RepID=A0A3P8SZ70_AMPPE